jgi:hypothetical protein
MRQQRQGLIVARSKHPGKGCCFFFELSMSGIGNAHCHPFAKPAQGRNKANIMDSRRAGPDLSPSLEISQRSVTKQVWLAL